MSKANHELINIIIISLEKSSFYLTRGESGGDSRNSGKLQQKKENCEILLMTSLNMFKNVFVLIVEHMLLLWLEKLQNIIGSIKGGPSPPATFLKSLFGNVWPFIIYERKIT